jgi:threonyl-tRNA synthetase
MPVITLPDGSKKTFDNAVSALAVAESIGPGLAKAAIAAKVDGAQTDIYLPINKDAKLEILTLKNPEGLDVMRHTLTAQVLARALKELFPDVKLAIGPTIDNGFYYDISGPHKVSTDDFPKIEKRMHEIIAEANSITREMLPKADAIKVFKDRGEHFKVDIIENAKDDDTTEKGKISIYWQGEDKRFVDLCRGPHLQNLSKIPLAAFKLTKVSWRLLARRCQQRTASAYLRRGVR